MSTQIQPTPIVTGEKAKEIETLCKTEFPQENIVRGKQILKSMFGNMEKDGYDYYIIDGLGGVHTDGVGYAPDGHFCGECTRDTCDSCQAWLNHSNGKALADAVKSIDVSMYEHWVNCSECVYFDECEIKEDRDGCLAGEEEEYEM